MDPITTAIIAALGAGVTAGTTDAAKEAVVNAYNGLKKLIQNKFGKEGDLADAVDRLEQKSDSKARQGVVQEEVCTAKADKDPDLLKAAQELLEQLKSIPGGEQHIQTAQGSFIAQADRNSKATVSVNQPKESGKNSTNT